MSEAQVRYDTAKAQYEIDSKVDPRMRFRTTWIDVILHSGQIYIQKALPAIDEDFMTPEPQASKTIAEKVI